MAKIIEKAEGMTSGSIQPEALRDGGVATSKFKRSSVAVAIALLFGLVGLSARSTFAQDASTDGVDTDAVSPDRLPLPVNVAGQWSGTITDDDLGAGDFTISISQTNRKLSGGWMATFTNQAPLLNKFDGRASAREVVLRLDNDVDRKACRLAFHSIIANRTEISGKYIWVDCKPQFKGRGGSIEITPLPPV
jgi:hypothetical protein